MSGMSAFICAQGEEKMERCEAVDGQQMAVWPVPSANVDVFRNVGCMLDEFRQDITCREAKLSAPFLSFTPLQSNLFIEIHRSQCVTATTGLI